MDYFLRLAVQRPLDIKNRPRIPIPDEDPYSIAGNGGGSGNSSGSSGFGTVNNISGLLNIENQNFIPNSAPIYLFCFLF